MDPKTKRPAECSDDRAVYIRYTNWEGKTGIRHIVPYQQAMYFGSTEWHKESQWLLPAWDIDKDAERTYALKDILSWSTEKPE